jgi:hypothetical protein
VNKNIIRLIILNLNKKDKSNVRWWRDNKEKC